MDKVQEFHDNQLNEEQKGHVQTAATAGGQLYNAVTGFFTSSGKTAGNDSTGTEGGAASEKGAQHQRVDSAQVPEEVKPSGEDAGSKDEQPQQGEQASEGQSTSKGEQAATDETAPKDESTSKEVSAPESKDQDQSADAGVPVTGQDTQDEPPKADAKDEGPVADESKGLGSADTKDLSKEDSPQKDEDGDGEKPAGQLDSTEKPSEPESSAIGLSQGENQGQDSEVKAAEPTEQDKPSTGSQTKEDGAPEGSSETQTKAPESEEPSSTDAAGPTAESGSAEPKGEGAQQVLGGDEPKDESKDEIRPDEKEATKESGLSEEATEGQDLKDTGLSETQPELLEASGDQPSREDAQQKAADNAPSGSAQVTNTAEEPKAEAGESESPEQAQEGDGGVSLGQGNDTKDIESSVHGQEPADTTTQEKPDATDSTDKGVEKEESPEDTTTKPSEDVKEGKPEDVSTDETPSQPLEGKDTAAETKDGEANSGASGVKDAGLHETQPEILDASEGGQQSIDDARTKAGENAPEAEDKIEQSGEAEKSKPDTESKDIAADTDAKETKEEGSEETAPTQAVLGGQDNDEKAPQSSETDNESKPTSSGQEGQSETPGEGVAVAGGSTEQDKDQAAPEAKEEAEQEESTGEQETSGTTDEPSTDATPAATGAEQTEQTSGDNDDKRDAVAGEEKPSEGVHEAKEAGLHETEPELLEASDDHPSHGDARDQAKENAPEASQSEGISGGGEEPKSEQQSEEQPSSSDNAVTNESEKTAETEEVPETEGASEPEKGTESESAKKLGEVVPESNVEQQQKSDEGQKPEESAAGGDQSTGGTWVDQQSGSGTADIQKEGVQGDNAETSEPVDSEKLSQGPPAPEEKAGTSEPGPAAPDSKPAGDEGLSQGQPVLEGTKPSAEDEARAQVQDDGVPSGELQAEDDGEGTSGGLKKKKLSERIKEKVKGITGSSE